MPRKTPKSARSFKNAEMALLRELDRVRAPLFRELDQLIRNPDYLKGRPAHACCTRRYNQMRISPLEAKAIAVAFQSDPVLRRKLPKVLDRLVAELPSLTESEERQNYTCPLLDNSRCLVHEKAKPIGCTAWHPETFDADDYRFTRTAWNAFEERDHLNDQLYGRQWKLRVIPLWLKRLFATELRKRSR